MKIKCIVLTILFCFVSSSALAISWPWSRPEVKPQISVSPRYWCKETPEIVKHLVGEDAYCCSNRFYLATDIVLFDSTKENVEICLGQNLARIRGATMELLDISILLDISPPIDFRGWSLGRTSGGSIDERIHRIVNYIDDSIMSYSDTRTQFERSRESESGSESPPRYDTPGDTPGS